MNPLQGILDDPLTSWVSLEEAVGTLTPHDRVVLPPGCGEALALEREIGRQHERLAGMTLLSGLLLSDYPFLHEDARFRYVTWHAMPPVRSLVSSGEAEFYPVRGSQLPGLFRRGDLAFDVAIVHVSPPDRRGRCSLGVSVSYPDTVARLGKRVIAQVNPQMPRTGGTCFLHVSALDLLVEVDEPLMEYREAEQDPISRAIGEHVAELIPEGATLQVGIGTIAEAALRSLVEVGLPDVQLYGMVTDAGVELAQAGQLGSTSRRRPPLLAAELMGTRRLFDYVDGNPALEMQPFERILDPLHIARIDRFVSVNTAVQIDLMGQANSEWFNGRQLSGIGGAFDFVQGARLSPGSRSIIAIPAARIVARLAEGTPVSVPRHYVQYVVTEHGAVNLEGLPLRARADALIGIADPAARAELESALGSFGRAAR